jgi:hypothetical protein
MRQSIRISEVVVFVVLNILQNVIAGNLKKIM